MLTEMRVMNAKAKERDYKLAGSEGLYLYATAKGHRSLRGTPNTGLPGTVC